MGKQDMLCNYISFSTFLAYFKCLNEVLRNNINDYLRYDSITWNPWKVQHSQKINGIS